MPALRNLHIRGNDDAYGREGRPGYNFDRGYQDRSQHTYTDRSYENVFTSNSHPEHSEGGSAAEYWHKWHTQKRDQQQEEEERNHPLPPCGEENCGDIWEYNKQQDDHQQLTSTTGTTGFNSIGSLAPVLALACIAFGALLGALVYYVRNRLRARRRMADYSRAALEFQEKELEERKLKIQSHLRCTQYMGPPKDGCTCASCTLLGKLEEGEVVEGGNKPEEESKNPTDENDNNTTTKECCICLELFSDHEWISFSNNLQCKHNFHKGCIENWLLRQDGCPTCRLPYLSAACLELKKEEEEDNTIISETVVGSIEETDSSHLREDHGEEEEEEEEADDQEEGTDSSNLREDQEEAIIGEGTGDSNCGENQEEEETGEPEMTA